MVRTGLCALLPLLAACSTAPRPAAEPSTPVRALPPGAEPPAVPDRLPAGFRDAFAQRDARARSIAFFQACSATLARLRAEGAFGAAAQAPRLFHCERTAEGVPIGGLFDVDSAFTTTRRLVLVRLDGARPRHTAPVDTARLLRQAHLARDAHRAVAANWRRQGRPFFVVPVTPDTGATEAWVIPYPVRVRTVILQGEVAFARAPNGGLTPLVDRSARWTAVPVPPTGLVELRSAEATAPAVADLVVARGLAEAGREVRLVTGAVTSALVAGVDPETGARVVWRHKAP